MASFLPITRLIRSMSEYFASDSKNNDMRVGYFHILVTLNSSKRLALELNQTHFGSSCYSLGTVKCRIKEITILFQVVLIKNLFMLSVRISSCDAGGKFGEHDRCVRVARGVAERNFSFLTSSLP